MNHALKDPTDQAALLERVSAFAREVVAPGAIVWERERRVGREAIDQAAAFGLCGIESPREHGGLGLPFSAKVQIAERLAAADFGFTMSLINTQNVSFKLLRDAVRGANPRATAEQFAQWLRDNAGAPNSYCSGNVFDLPVGRTRDEEVTLRRYLAKQVVAILTEAEAVKGDARAAFVKQRMEVLQQDVLARRQA